MIARLFAFCLFPFLGIGFIVSEAIVKKGDLLARWSFDERNGTIANETEGSGVNAILVGANWGSGENAMSMGSLDVSSGNSFAPRRLTP